MSAVGGRLGGRAAVLGLMLLVPLALAVASQALASRPGAPALPTGPVVVGGGDLPAPGGGVTVAPTPTHGPTPPATPAPGASPAGGDPAPAPVPADAPRVVRPPRPAPAPPADGAADDTGDETAVEGDGAEASGGDDG